MNEIFSYITTAKIDAKLHKDILAHEDKIEKILIVILCILLILFNSWIVCWLRFGIAVPCAYERSSINTFDAPVQTDYNDEEKAAKTFIYKSLINDYKVKLMPQAHYKLSGSVAAYDYGFLFIDDYFNSIALYDAGIAWEKLSDKKFYNTYFTSYIDRSAAANSRVIYTKFKPELMPLSDEYLKTHFSHSHIIPANRNIMAAMLKLKKWDKVKIEGELVDLEYHKTSLSRNDTNDTSRGNSASEIIYVTSVQIGHYIYK